MAEGVEASGLRSKIRVLQEKFRSASVKVPADTLAVIVMFERCLYLERQIKKWKQALVEVDRKLQVGSIAALSAQLSAFSKADDACKWC